MRTPDVILFLGLFGSSAPAATPSRDGPHCAFGDESFMTLFAVSTAVTAYYVRHHAWPTSRQQLRAQILEVARTMRPPDKPSPADVDQLLSRFSRLDLQPRGRDLVLAVEYRAAGKRHRYRMLIPPGRSSEEMMEASREIK
jgi:hypothetical protein